MKVTIKAGNPEPLAADIRAIPARLKKAGLVAIGEVTRNTAEELAVDVAAASRLARKHLKRGRGLGPRVYFRVPKGRSETIAGNVWIGTRPIPAEYLGNPSQSKDGVRVGDHFFPGAFVATMPTGHKGVYMRHEVTVRHTKGRPLTSSPNLPIVAQEVEVDAAETVLNIEAGLPLEIEQALDRAIDRELRRNE